MKMTKKEIEINKMIIQKIEKSVRNNTFYLIVNKLPISLYGYRFHLSYEGQLFYQILKRLCLNVTRYDVYYSDRKVRANRNIIYIPEHLRTIPREVLFEKTK